MEAIEIYLGKLTGFMDKVGGLVILPLISIVVILDVGLRYIFNSPFIWGLEFTEWGLLLVFLFAIPECTRTHGHVRMELLIRAVNPYSQKLLSLFYCASGMFIFFLLARHGWEEFWFDFELGRVTEYLSLPYWAWTGTMFLISVILLAYYALRIIAVFIKTDAFTHVESNIFED
ncbi:MAG: TRAP transporter small permease [Rhodospirillales bacterium]